MAPVLYNEGLAAKTLDEGQRLDEYLGSLNELFHLLSEAPDYDA
jgi:hypothetical protein